MTRDDFRIRRVPTGFRVTTPNPGSIPAGEPRARDACTSPSCQHCARCGYNPDGTGQFTDCKGYTHD